VKRAAPLLALALGACTTRLLPAPEDVRFDPIRFFHAPAEGRGTLYKLVGAPVPVHVSSTSVGDLDQLSVTQLIREGDKPPRKRIWVIRRVGDGDYAATLTDAVGPVRITVDRGRAFIRYRMKGGLTVDQQLALHGRDPVLCNRLSVRKFGIRIAWLNETIRRQPLGRDVPVNCPA
jgi:hypothetical protein